MKMDLIVELAVPTLKRILEIEDARTRQLNAIQKTVQAQLEGPYQSALIHLARADSPSVSSEQRAEHLRRAEERFIDALGNFRGTEPLQRAWAGIYLAGICMLVDRAEEALLWASEAHADAVKATTIECREANYRLQANATRSRWLRKYSPNEIDAFAMRGGRAVMVAAAAGVTIASTITAPVVVGGLALGGSISIKAYRAYWRKKLGERLRELSSFVDQIVDLMRRLGDADVPQYVLSIDRDGFFIFGSNGAEPAPIDQQVG